MPTATIQSPPDTTPISRTGSSAVTYHIPHHPPSSKSPYKTTIVLPKDSAWSSELHWHETHTEYLCLKRGAIYVELDGAVCILSAKHGSVFSVPKSSSSTGPGSATIPIQDGVVTVEKGVRHCWHRASHYYAAHQLSKLQGVIEFPLDIDDEVVVEEWTDPSDVMKPLFFFNLNAVISSSASAPLPIAATLARWMLGRWWIDFQLFVVFHGLDNWPVLWTAGGRSAGYVVTHLVLLASAVVGKLVGVEAVSEGRTPKRLWDAWRGGEGIGKKTE